MAFIPSTFLGQSLSSSHSLSKVRQASQRPNSYVQARAGNNRKKPRNNSDRPEYRPFDGSQPLLPPWRPPSLEASFSYTARRIVTRETNTRKSDSGKLVQVRSEGFGTLYAQVVQEVGENGKVWLRPLLLDGEGGFVDLRGGNDVVLKEAIVEGVETELGVRVRANLAATEADLVNRVVEDERWGETGSKALLAFMRSLYQQK